MACIDHRCEECGEVWSDNSLYSVCEVCNNLNKGCWDEERFLNLRDEYHDCDKDVDDEERDKLIED